MRENVPRWERGRDMAFEGKVETEDATVGSCISPSLVWLRPHLATLLHCKHVVLARSRIVGFYALCRFWFTPS